MTEASYIARTVGLIRASELTAQGAALLDVGSASRIACYRMKMSTTGDYGRPLLAISASPDAG